MFENMRDDAGGQAALSGTDLHHRKPVRITHDLAHFVDLDCQHFAKDRMQMRCCVIITVWTESNRCGHVIAVTRIIECHLHKGGKRYRSLAIDPIGDNLFERVAIHTLTLQRPVLLANEYGLESAVSIRHQTAQSR